MLIIVNCNKIKTIPNLFLSKEEIEKGKRKSSDSLTMFEENLLENGFHKDNSFYSINPESFTNECSLINYYYNVYVIAMASLMEHVMLDGSRNSPYDNMKYQKNIKFLEKATTYHSAGDERICHDWDGIRKLCYIKRTEPCNAFGVVTTTLIFTPKVKASTEEMLEWMDYADSILKKKRKYKPPVPLTPEEIAERERRWKEIEEKEKRSD